jgi:dolichol-phosphate mannosyltransferase
MASFSFALPGSRTRLAFKFALVGASGLLVNQLALALFTEFGEIPVLVSAIAATQVSSTWNFLGSEYWVFSGRLSRGSRFGRYFAFMALNNVSLLLRIPMLWVLYDVLGIHYLIANPITLLVLWALRFAFADGWIWRTTSAVRADGGSADGGSADGGSADGGSDASIMERTGLRIISSGPGEATYHYDIAGVLRIDSDVRLRELFHFLTDVPGRPDIQIKTQRVGGLPGRRTRFVASGSTLSYYEHLGMAGANFRITMGDPITVEAAALLARSPHVLYTNVVEALLRFVLTSRGYVLLHSACLVANGQAMLLSAQTDTGKTSTVIRLVREHGYEFLSDDMTIISSDGRALCYPKPMTLSYHTMSSIKGGELRGRERAALAVQSRLHSKSGRSVGRFLGGLNIPIMSVNSIVQILVPPPKFAIDALMPAAIGTEAPISHVFLMERGEASTERVAIDEGIPTLIANTDDAYGFPPFATFAPHLRIGADDYDALRNKEEALLRSALKKARIIRVRVPGHEWAEQLPEFLRGYDEELEGDGVAGLIAIPIEGEVIDSRPVRNAG